MTKFKSPSCDKTQTSIVTKMKNSNCDKTQKLKLWQNLKFQIVTKLNNSKCDKAKNSICDKTKKLLLWHNSKTPIVTKLKNSNWDKTQSLQLCQNLTVVIRVGQLVDSWSNTILSQIVGSLFASQIVGCWNLDSIHFFQSISWVNISIQLLKSNSWISDDLSLEMQFFFY